MPSQTDLLNDALGQIGAEAISAIDDGSTNANHCSRFYAPLRDSLLRSHHWNFAMKRQELAQDLTAPVFEFAYAYTLPADCLKLVEYIGSNSTSTSWLVGTEGVLKRYRVEGRTIVTNDGVVSIRYLRRVENPDEFDAIFYQVLTTWLASKLALAIFKDPKMAAGILAMAMEVLLPIASAVDGQEDSVEPFIVDDLTWGRGRA